MSICTQLPGKPLESLRRNVVGKLIELQLTLQRLTVGWQVFAAEFTALMEIKRKSCSLEPIL